MNIKKISNIIFIAVFVALLFGFFINLGNFIDTNQSIKDIKDAIANQDNNSDESDLNVPISDELKGDSTNNVGARNDKNATHCSLEIINLDILSKYLKTNNDELLEVYSGTYSQVKSLLIKDTYGYIDESSIVYKEPKLSYTLLEYSTDKEIAKVEIIFNDINNEKNSSYVSDFKVDNLNSLKDVIPSGGESSLYVYDLIKTEIQRDFKDVRRCLIDEKTITKKDETVSFTVFDSKTKSKLKTIKVSF